MQALNKSKAERSRARAFSPPEPQQHQSQPENQITCEAIPEIVRDIKTAENSG